MSSSSPPRRRHPHPRHQRRSHAVPIALGAVIAAAAIGAIGYLLWPTWSVAKPGDPGRIPVIVGDTLFNVPTRAFRVKLQRRPGVQERVDLAFLYPALTPPDAPKHVSTDTIDEAHPVAIDRLFVSIAAHRDALAPLERLRTIYPRYLEGVAASENGVTRRAFRDGSPYAREDLFTAEPAFSARCTRDGATPGMCISERRVEGADVTFRFPRSWLGDWRGVAEALDRLEADLKGRRS